MTLKHNKPVTPSSRQRVAIDRSKLYRGRPCKSLLLSFGRTGGRNNFGRITSRFRGGGHKRLYRVIDFKRQLRNDTAVVQRIEYDPYRTAFIALLKHESGKMSYILSPDGLKVGVTVNAGLSAEISIGNALPLSAIPVGTVIHNIELKPGAGGKIARAAGAHCLIMGKDNDYAKIRLSSGEVKLISVACFATIGTASNLDNKNVVIAKAGRNAWRGRKPSVRGVAMNPVDHPHGGGEGKTSRGGPPVTPWGVQCKGLKTRHNKRTNRSIIEKKK